MSRARMPPLLRFISMFYEQYLGEAFFSDYFAPCHTEHTSAFCPTNGHF